MTMTSVGSQIRYPKLDSILTGTAIGFTFDTATDVLAVIFPIPATGTIANVHSRVTTATSPVMTHRCQLRTVDATTGKPNAAGVLYGSSTSVTKDASTYTTNTNWTWAVNATAVAGDLVALVFDLSAFTSGSFMQAQRYAGVISGGSGVFPYHMTNTAGTDTLAALGMNAFALEYSGGVYHPLIFDAIVSAIATNTVTNSGVTRRGNKFRPPVAMRASGIWMTGDLDGDCFLRVRKVSDDSLLATATVDKDNRGQTTVGEYAYLFDAGAKITLDAGTDYYVLVEGNSATTDTIYSLSSIPSNAQLGMLSGGANCYATSYNAGYTDVNTQIYAIGSLIDGVDDGAGGGAGGGGLKLIGTGGLVG